MIFIWGENDSQPLFYTITKIVLRPQIYMQMRKHKTSRRKSISSPPQGLSINFLNWSIIDLQHQFQMYNIIIQYLIYCKMIATISLVVCHHTQFQKLFFVIRILKIYSHNNSQICNTVILTIVIMLYIISLRLICFITESLCLLASSLILPTLHPLPLATTSLFSVSVS